MTAISPRRSALALAVAGALLAAGCAPALAGGRRVAADASALSMLSSGQVAGRSAVPWRLVGPGWTLAVADTAPLNVAQHAHVLLIDPHGGEYAIFSWPTLVNPRFVDLLDWSGDRQRALFELTSSPGTPRLDQLTLRTGALTSALIAPYLIPLTYTRPLGKQALALGENIGQSVARISIAGRVIKWLAPGHTFRNAVMSPDGQLIAAGTARAITFVSNAGGVVRQVAIPGANPAYGCNALRWWDAAAVLASCAKRLWLVPAGQGAPAALTKQPQTRLVDGWRAGASLFVQAFLPASTYPGCDVGLERQEADGSLVVVQAPGLGCSSGGVLASAGGRLLLLGQPGYAAGSLRWFDPATGKVQILYTPKSGTPGIVWAVAFGNGPPDQFFGG